MTTADHLIDDSHPIDVVENLAHTQAWKFERIADDQIAMDVVGQWRNYALTLAWSDYDEALRLLCSFPMEPPPEKIAAIYELLNEMNDRCWTGAFTYWAERKLMVFRYSLLLTGGQIASAEQISEMIETAVLTAERYYPAIQLTVWGDQPARAAIQVAMADAYGRA